jgi:thioredoxin 1
MSDNRLLEVIWFCIAVVMCACIVAAVWVSNTGQCGVVPVVAFPDGPPPLTIEEFEQLQTELKKKPAAPVEVVSILDFYADWCGPCRASKPAIDQLERQGYAVTRIDVDTAEGREQKRLNNVGAIPTFIGRVNGAEKFRTHDVQQLKRKLADLPKKTPTPQPSPGPYVPIIPPGPPDPRYPRL